MSYSVDANVLLYASDERSPFHARAAEFLATCAAGTESFCLTWPTLMAYLRISTHPSLFKNPLSTAEATANIEALLHLPHVMLLSEREGFWDVYRRATQRLTLRGNLVSDAHLAALLLQHEVTVLYTNDSDFEQFDFLHLRNPFA